MKEEIKLPPPKETTVGFSWIHEQENVAGSQRLLQDVLQIVVQKHVLTNQTFDGKQLNDLVLGPDSKLVMLC
jgi:hypothetical protein